jgi:hypothetical protein
VADFEPQHRRAVLLLERFDLPARIEDDRAQRAALVLFRRREGRVDNGVGLFET